MIVRPNTTGQHYELSGPDSPMLIHGNQFLAAVAARGLAATTLRAYAFDLVVCARWIVQSGKTIEQLQQADLLDFITAERERRMNAWSINRRLTTLEAFFIFS